MMLAVMGVMGTVTAVLRMTNTAVFTMKGHKYEPKRIQRRKECACQSEDPYKFPYRRP
jgi:hypothetical protein